MPFFDNVVKKVKRNKKATVSYSLVAVIIIVASILVKESKSESDLERVGLGLLMLSVLVAAGTFFAQKACPNACAQKTPEQLALMRTDSKYTIINQQQQEEADEDEEINNRFGSCFDAL